jgi:hypothetical protein
LLPWDFFAFPPRFVFYTISENGSGEEEDQEGEVRPSHSMWLDLIRDFTFDLVR